MWLEAANFINMSLRKDDKQIQKQRKECREGKNELKGKNM